MDNINTATSFNNLPLNVRTALMGYLEISKSMGIGGTLGVAVAHLYAERAKLNASTDVVERAEREVFPAVLGAHEAAWAMVDGQARDRAFTVPSRSDIQIAFVAFAQIADGASEAVGEEAALMAAIAWGASQARSIPEHMRAGAFGETLRLAEEIGADAAAYTLATRVTSPGSADRN